MQRVLYNNFFELLIVFSFVIIASCGCEQKSCVDSLFEAQKCIENREWNVAERYLESYLREEENLNLRFNAWNRLLTVGEHLNYNEHWMITCLEEMRSEFEGCPEQLKIILWRLATTYDYIKKYERSVECWEKLFNQPELPIEQQGNILRKLAVANMRLHRFEEADAFLTICLELSINQIAKLECLVDRADIASSRGLFDDGAYYARLVLEAEDSPSELKGKAGFILADIKEQQGDVQNAIEVFTAIRDLYPNEMVIDQRLQLLQTKNKH